MSHLEYSICNLSNKKNLICHFETLVDCSSMWEVQDGIELVGIERKIKTNLSDKDIENIKIRNSVKEFIKIAKEKGITLTMVTELSASDLLKIIVKNSEIREFRIFKVFDGGIVTNDPDWIDVFTPINLFEKSLIRSGHSQEKSIALTSSLYGVKSAINAGLQVVAVPTKENLIDADYISGLVDYYISIEEFTKRLSL